MPPWMRDGELLTRLEGNPEIRERLEATLLAVADEQGKLARASGEKVKKLCWYTTFGEVSVEEIQLRAGTPEFDSY